jgi:hypothetical protein
VGFELKILVFEALHPAVTATGTDTITTQISVQMILERLGNGIFTIAWKVIFLNHYKSEKNFHIVLFWGYETV